MTEKLTRAFWQQDGKNSFVLRPFENEAPGLYIGVTLANTSDNAATIYHPFNVSTSQQLVTQDILDDISDLTKLPNLLYQIQINRFMHKFKFRWAPLFCPLYLGVVDRTTDNTSENGNMLLEHYPNFFKSKKNPR